MSKSNLAAGDDVSDDEVVRVGLNGFGRIGRNVFRAVLESPRIELVGINDVMDFDDMGYLAKYDTVMGRLDGVERDGDELTVGDTAVPLFNVQDPADLPWDELDVDVALECTGVFRTRDDASAHLDGGADTVIISAPPKGDKPVKQLVYGVNHDEYEGDDVISNASCTTNSITPVAKVLDAEFGIDAGTLTTVHAYTGSQSLIDGPMSKRRRGRAAAENIVPTSTGAAGAAQKVLPQLEGKIDGMAMRVPVPTGSLTEFVVSLDETVTEEEVNAAFREAADSGPLAGVLGYTDDEVVSSDIVGLPFSSYVDLQSTNVIAGGKLLKILTWYDNEYGFSNRLLDMAAYVHDEA
ncbi:MULTISPECIES: type I glyceraldehyde-3-phosphate dehydrogenase [Halorubrum]|uniref:glyceraldehyde-3-phosphate dehydrogenase (NAD(P)(+)) (phosphorylating) n=2 Tax=Halorubrum ezzemoulense TaxID=337243 RepID=A0A256K1M6_HALEZ|nr:MULTISPECIES: type I glyceraldehyde-3-phosphate dehydrogenase [Halorubrum]MDB2224345.1 type I glyceraldehyde-3-phosphate dehydrogenase [Halorubrum ezzemoulense]MDB2238280.1 type I glyceraldehyde-3-phosphate dehydrogenase [Halorubrum ezzemoulense]MDB2240067.1 type I glyceraldehyde-3-phosphate dehydrogenase [Halorubrum ezzemoulense]MDB2247749.1 type I glyceraldehyde-3-phosphate dehydrogenase [Halorubrum ezzemoulense]MDB2260445.1 type I glyceraldehyde-3-phosphate dehydrogenase [Halorubrum ezze